MQSGSTRWAHQIGFTLRHISAREDAAAAITSAGTHATSNTRWVRQKTTVKGDIGNAQLTVVINPATKARVSSGGSMRRTC